VPTADGGSRRGRVFSLLVGAVQGDRGSVSMENGVKRDIDVTGGVKFPTFGGIKFPT